MSATSRAISVVIDASVSAKSANVEEALARLLRDLHHDPIGENPGAAGDRAAVAARLPDDRGRFAGDG
jgi:hypothetical protein